MLIGLVVVTIASLFMRDERKMRVTSVLMGNWALCTLIATMTGSLILWPVMASVDYVSAILVMLYPISRWQVVVCVLYIAELVFHAAYGVTVHTDTAIRRYYWALYDAAWLQVIVTGAWMAYDTARESLGRDRGSGRRMWARKPLSRRAPEMPGEKECS